MGPAPSTGRSSPPSQSSTVHCATYSGSSVPFLGMLFTVLYWFRPLASAVRARRSIRVTRVMPDVPAVVTLVDCRLVPCVSGAFHVFEWRLVAVELLAVLGKINRLAAVPTGPFFHSTPWTFGRCPDQSINHPRRSSSDTSSERTRSYTSVRPPGASIPYGLMYWSNS